MAERLIKLPETKGEFKVAGIVTGTEKGDKFYSNKTTAKGTEMNTISFGLNVNKDCTVYVDLKGFIRDNVYFYKRPKDKNSKGDTKKVAWKDRKSFKEEGYKLIGVNVGITKKLADNGEKVNDNKMLTEYDACNYIGNTLKDNESVFVKGNIQYSSFASNKDDSIIRSVQFVPNQISLCRPIDFSKDDYKETNAFKQLIIFMSATEDMDNPKDKKGIIEAKIVTYNTIEDTSFIIRDSKLFGLFKRKLKPYTAIEVWGHINNKLVVEEDEEEDEWGEKNNYDTVVRSFIKELVIIGADPKSIDTETYCKDEIEKAIKALDDFGYNKVDTTKNKTNNTNDDDWGLPVDDGEDTPW